MSQEPTAAEALAFMEAQMAEHGALSSSEALHSFYGLIQAITMLRADTVDAALRLQDWRYRHVAEGGQLSELFPDGGQDVTAAVDWMGDVFRAGSSLLADWLLDHDLHDGVDLIVYLPCHGDFDVQSFRPKAGAR